MDESERIKFRSPRPDTYFCAGEDKRIILHLELLQSINRLRAADRLKRGRFSIQ